MFRSGSPFRSRSPAYQRKRSLSRDDEVVIHKMKVPMILLNVTRLTNFRKDGHPSIYGKNVTDGRKVSTRRHDCSHWCVPGVPDAWNELIYVSLILQQTTPPNLKAQGNYSPDQISERERALNNLVKDARD
ncbi:hypothetical protein IFM89_021751 [Coptis chinensis]|uniref:Trichome birefringence-like C-terminal domain-containing protein n=1 Tax=Coptis chinensis TaxID=261450 RepID=A0A835LI51_9MAGN|nr:hypothetical protein IFM89_021751 [Coptis chinensis]